MQYYRLYDLTNQYPSIGNYITRTPGIVNFYGLYPETNINPIPIKNLDGIKYVSGCTFRFIANIKEKDSDTFGKLYTSEKYFKDLEASITESNPYFTNQSLQDIFIVDISLERFKILFNSLTDKENIAGVDVFFNNFVEKGNKINYEYFVKFLNWVVSLPSLSEIDTNGVIPANQLLAFETYEIDQERAYFYPNEIQRPGNKGNQQSGTGNSTTNTTTIPPPTEEEQTPEQQPKPGTFVGNLIRKIESVPVIGAVVTGVKAVVNAVGSAVKAVGKFFKKLFSDKRVKENVIKVATIGDINIYKFNYIWDKDSEQYGVIAQELLGTKYESAVFVDEDSGLYKVDYEKLNEMVDIQSFINQLEQKD
jgi:hypothetical protein